MGMFTFGAVLVSDGVRKNDAKTWVVGLVVLGLGRDTANHRHSGEAAGQAEM